VIGVRQRGPVGDGRVLPHPRPGAAAVEDRSDVVAAHFVRRDRADVRLSHLADLLLERHAAHDARDPRFHRGIGRGGGAECRPVLAVPEQVAARRGAGAACQQGKDQPEPGSQSFHRVTRSLGAVRGPRGKKRGGAGHDRAPPLE
ncbi:hypothetical protein QU38_01425, partial [Staphylococcus aureus]